MKINMVNRLCVWDLNY